VHREEMAPLQAEVSARGFGLANVPNVRWYLLHDLSLHETQQFNIPNSTHIHYRYSFSLFSFFE